MDTENNVPAKLSGRKAIIVDAIAHESIVFLIEKVDDNWLCGQVPSINSSVDDIVSTVWVADNKLVGSACYSEHQMKNFRETAKSSYAVF